MKKIIVILSMILIAVMAVGCEKQTEKPNTIEEVVLEEQVLEQEVLEETYLEETLYKIDGIKLNEYFIRMNYGDEAFELIRYYTEEYKHHECGNCEIGSFVTNMITDYDNNYFANVLTPNCVVACWDQNPDQRECILNEWDE